MADITTTCVNGELRPGDLVLSSPKNDYACLIGTVLAIEKAGTPDHHTDNEGNDIHVNFMDAEYSESRMLEIQDMLWDLDGRPTPPKPGVLPPLDVDDVIMAPDMLIRITGIGREELAKILDSGKNAAAYYERAAAVHVSDLNDKDKPLFEGSASYNQIRQFSDRVDQHYKVFENAMLEKSKEEIFGAAEKIAAMDNARYYLTEYAHEFSPEDIEGLMKLDDPLSVVAFGWRKYTEDLSDMSSLARFTAISADIAKGGLDSDNADKRVMRSFIPDAGKPSVLDMIRQAREDAKRNPVPRKDAPAKGREPEL